MLKNLPIALLKRGFDDLCNIWSRVFMTRYSLLALTKRSFQRKGRLNKMVELGMCSSFLIVAFLSSIFPGHYTFLVHQIQTMWFFVGRFRLTLSFGVSPRANHFPFPSY